MSLLTDQLIADAFQLAVQQKSSLRDVRVYLAAHGVAGRNGEPLSLARIHRILHDNRYTEPAADSPALVSKHLFRKVQKRLRQRQCTKK